MGTRERHTEHTCQPRLGWPRRERVEDASADHESEDVEVIGAAALYREHAGFVAGLLRRLGARNELIPDLVQEVFLVVHRRGGFVPNRARPTTWLGEIAVRILSSRRRHERRRPEDSASPTIEVRSGEAMLSPVRLAESNLALARVQKALESLCSKDQMVLVLFELEQHSCSEISRMLEVPIGTVYSRLHTARRRLLAAYDRRPRTAAPIAEAC